MSEQRREEGREEGRGGKGGREGGRGGREGGREEGRKGEREGGREGGKERGVEEKKKLLIPYVSCTDCCSRVWVRNDEASSSPVLLLNIFSSIPWTVTSGIPVEICI